MKVKINTDNDELYCLYFKEKIPVGDRYVEVIEDYLGDEITKIYSYECLEMLIDDYLENDGVEPNIFGDE